MIASSFKCVKVISKQYKIKMKLLETSKIYNKLKDYNKNKRRMILKLMNKLKNSNLIVLSLINRAWIQQIYLYNYKKVSMYTISNKLNKQLNKFFNMMFKVQTKKLQRV